MRYKVYSFIKDGKECYKERADRDIEINRKGKFEIIAVDENGNLLPDGQLADIKMTDLDCALFLKECKTGADADTEILLPMPGMQCCRNHTTVFNIFENNDKT